MKKITIRIIIGILQIILICLVPRLVADYDDGEYDFGTVEVKIRLNGGEWQDPGITGITLKLYEPFEIKATLTNKVKSSAGVMIQGAGSTKTFEMLKGECEWKKWCSKPSVEAGVTKTYEWTMRPIETRFVGGTTPLKMYYQFTRWNDEFEETENDYGAINLISPTISHEIWDSYNDNIDNNQDLNRLNNKNENKSPGFILIIILISLLIISSYKKNKF